MDIEQHKAMIDKLCAGLVNKYMIARHPELHTSEDVYTCECEVCQTWCKEQEMDWDLKDE